MSEVQNRPHRGRTAARGGRGGPRGGARASNRHVNGDHKATADVDTTADQGEVGEMKKQYSSQLAMLKEMFPDWTDVDLLFALEENGGDVMSTTERITEGNVSQFAEVSKKPKDKIKGKPKEASAGMSEATASGSRPPRGRASAEAARGGRSRPERGRGSARGGARGGAQPSANGTRATSGAQSIPTSESSAWASIPTAKSDTKPAATTGETAAGGQWASVIASEATPKTASEGTKSSLIPEGGPKKTWASMFAPAPKSVAQAPKKPPQVQQLEGAIGGFADALPSAPPLVEAIAPSKDELTEDNVEHLPDYSNKPPATETAASQVGSSHDIGGSLPGSGTPSLAQQPIGSLRPPLGGYATSATKAMAGAGRSASFQRRILEQQEAVVMPNNHALDRAAVQFGMMGLNGDALDVDDEREDAETRPQAPPQSPPSQPRASLPPVSRQAADVSDASTAPKQAPGLPPLPQQGVSQQHPSPSHPGGAQAASQSAGQAAQGYNRYGGFSHVDMSGPAQKTYDPFGQQAAQTPLDAYGSSTQGQQAQSHPGSQTSAPNDYSSYYTAEQRNAYQNYYGSTYGQQHAAGQQDAGGAQQRAGSAFGAAPGSSTYSAPSQQGSNQGRYGENQNSGQNTPNPPPGTHGQHQSQQSQHVPQQHHNQAQQGGYPGYGGAHPYYNSPYYQAYMNQYNYGGQGYGGPYGGGKGGGYGQSQHNYGMPPQHSGYAEHASSPANVGGFNQSSTHGRDNALGSGSGGLGDYGRSGSAQPADAQGSGAAGFGGLGDYGRNQNTFGTGNQSFGQQQPGTQTSVSEDALKAYSDAKSGAGASSGQLGQPGRPGSATNTSSSQGHSGLPPSQSHQQGYGGYPSQYSQSSQYGSLGGLGHQGGQSHQGGGFGGYGGGYGNNNYNSYGRGGGWSANYGGH